jgi:hypothetical protein
MNCPHAKPLSHDINLCALGLYGGKPSTGTCLKCMDAGENTAEFADALFDRGRQAHPSNRARLSGCCDRADQA